MKTSTIIKWVLVIVIIVGTGLYFAEMVRDNQPEMKCVLGLGPERDPTLCYGWSKVSSPGKTR